MARDRVAPSILTAVRALHRVLTREAVQSAFIGALARAGWAEARATTDVDAQIAVEGEQWPRLVEALEDDGFVLLKVTPPAEPTDFVPDQAFFRTPGGVRVDLLVAKTDFEREALARSVEATVIGETLRIVTREDLLVYKVIAGRPRDMVDVIAIIDAADAGGHVVDWEHVERWCAAWEVSDRLAKVRARTGH